MQPWDPNCITRDGVPTLQCIPSVFNNIVHAVLLFSGLVALVFIIIGGMKYIHAEGDAKSAEGARKTLTYAILGLVLVLMAYFIITFIAYITKQNCILQFGFTNC